MVDKYTSSVISFLRFPLAIMVVYVHYFGAAPCDMSHVEVESFSELDLYNIIRVGITATICQVAVPSFFLISGFLFFNNLNDWNWKVWKGKMYRRIFTLLIPYLLWNCIRLCFNVTITGYHIFHRQGIDPAWLWLKEQITPLMFWAMDNTKCPIHTPFWFIRDLIIMVCISPLFFLIMKKRVAGLLTLSCMCIIYCLQLMPMQPAESFPGFSITAMLFFGVGAYLSIHKVKFTPPILPLRAIIFLMFSIFVILNVEFYSDPYLHLYVMPWVVLTGVPTFIFVAGSLVSRGVSIPLQLTDSSFFVFAFHAFTLVILWNIDEKLGIYSDWIPWLRIVTYLAIPILTSFLCAYLFNWLNHHTPTLCKVITGKQATTKKY